MALEPIDCTTHSREIEQEYLKVVKGTDSDTTWLIISPNGEKEYVPGSSGSEFADFLSSFDETKVEFGIARVSPPGSDVGKVILIGWCPDSAQMKTRASFAANFATVANQVLKGYHVQVTARDEDDLDENELLSKISNAAGARYSIQTSGLNNTPKPTTNNATPVKKVFTPSKTAEIPKTKEQSHIPPPVQSQPEPKKNTINNEDDDDWNEPEIEERDFDKAPLQGSNSTYQPIGKIDLKKVIAEEQAKEDPRLIHKIDPQSDITHLKEESKLKRDHDLDNLLHQESRPTTGTKPPLVKSDFSKADNSDKIIRGFKTEKSPAQLWAEKKNKQNHKDSQSESVPDIVRNVAEKPSQDDEEEVGISDLKSKFEKLGAQSVNDEPTIISPKPFSKPISSEPVEEKKTFTPAKIGQPLPGMHTEVSDHEEEATDNDDWSEDENETPARNIPPPVLPSRSSEPKPEEEEDEEAPAPSLPSRDTISEPVTKEEPEVLEEQEEETAPVLPSRGGVPPPPPKRATEEPAKAWAIAEYDYEAGEDNELNFNENDKIINIEFVDDDWWLGELEKTGEKGLFPRNYVALGN